MADWRSTSGGGLDRWADRYVAFTAVPEQERGCRRRVQSERWRVRLSSFAEPSGDGERFWLINGYTVFVDDRTAITGRAEVGALAAVKGTRMMGDSLLATRWPSSGLGVCHSGVRGHAGRCFRQ